jgi:hypothetical protein
LFTVCIKRNLHEDEKISLIPDELGKIIPNYEITLGIMKGTYLFEVLNVCGM